MSNKDNDKNIVAVFNFALYSFNPTLANNVVLTKQMKALDTAVFDAFDQY